MFVDPPGKVFNCINYFNTLDTLWCLLLSILVKFKVYLQSFAFKLYWISLYFSFLFIKKRLIYELNTLCLFLTLKTLFLIRFFSYFNVHTYLILEHWLSDTMSFLVFMALERFLRTEILVTGCACKICLVASFIPKCICPIWVLSFSMLSSCLCTFKCIWTASESAWVSLWWTLH